MMCFNDVYEKKPIQKTKPKFGFETFKIYVVKIEFVIFFRFLKIYHFF